jgi:magnesium-transporting ATPase (P-type)
MKDIKEDLWHNLSWEEVVKRLNSDSEKGLSGKEVEFRLKRFGKNKLPEKQPLSKIKIFLHQFRGPLIYILIIVGIVVLILEDYPQNFFESGFIFLVIFVNSLLDFGKRTKAQKL